MLLSSENVLQRRLLNENAIDISLFNVKIRQLETALKEALDSQARSGALVVELRKDNGSLLIALTEVRESLVAAQEAIDRERWYWGLGGLAIGAGIVITVWIMSGLK
jgi:hypothetical protein